MIKKVLLYLLERGSINSKNGLNFRFGLKTVTNLQPIHDRADRVAFRVSPTHILARLKGALTVRYYLYPARIHLRDIGKTNDKEHAPLGLVETR